MKDWIKISLVLCSFGFFREFRPSEPYVTQFLSDERWRNVTSDQVNREIYPIGTYSYLAQLCVVFLVTDILRYKPIIIASALVGLVLWSLLLWTSSIQMLYLVQVCYGFYMAAEIAYYTYMYAKVEKENYQRVTGNARASLLSGRFIASVLAQILETTKLMNIRELNYISLGAQGVSLAVALALPSVGVSMYMWSYDTPQLHENIPTGSVSPVMTDKQAKCTSSTENLTKPKFSWTRARSLMWKHFLDAYSNRTVLLWSIWWSLAMGGFLQIQSYVQILWIEIDVESRLNGGVEASLTLLGAISCLVAGYIPSDIFKKYDMWILATCSLLEGVLVIVSSMTSSIYIAYLMYILFGSVYMFMITLASATVAVNLAEDSFALIFGINTLWALVIQTILTVVLVSDSGLGLSPRRQFLVFGSYFVGLACIYLVGSIVKLIIKKKK